MLCRRSKVSSTLLYFELQEVKLHLHGNGMHWMNWNRSHLHCEVYCTAPFTSWMLKLLSSSQWEVKAALSFCKPTTIKPAQGNIVSHVQTACGSQTNIFWCILKHLQDNIELEEVKTAPTFKPMLNKLQRTKDPFQCVVWTSNDSKELEPWSKELEPWSRTHFSVLYELQMTLRN